MSISYGWQPSEWLDFTLSELDFALEQAEIIVEDRNYDEWSRAAYVALAVYNSNSKKKHKLTDLIGLPPTKKRQQKKEQIKIDTNDKEKMKQIALNKGLDVSF